MPTVTVSSSSFTNEVITQHEGTFFISGACAKQYLEGNSFSNITLTPLSNEKNSPDPAVVDECVLRESVIDSSSDTFYGYIFSGLTYKTRSAFTCLNSTFTKCTRSFSAPSLSPPSSLLDNKCPTTLPDGDYAVYSITENCTYSSHAFLRRSSLDDGANYTFKYCTWIHSSCTYEEGGAICAKGSTSWVITVAHVYNFIVDMCVFIDCRSSSDGGAIYAFGVYNVSITNCAFSACSCSESGNAIGANTVETNMIVNNCTFGGTTNSRYDVDAHNSYGTIRNSHSFNNIRLCIATDTCPSKPSITAPDLTAQFYVPVSQTATDHSCTSQTTSSCLTLYTAFTRWLNYVGGSVTFLNSNHTAEKQTITVEGQTVTLTASESTNTLTITEGFPDSDVFLLYNSRLTISGFTIDILKPLGDGCLLYCPITKDSPKSSSAILETMTIISHTAEPFEQSLFYFDIGTLAISDTSITSFTFSTAFPFHQTEDTVDFYTFSNVSFSNIIFDGETGCGSVFYRTPKSIERLYNMSFTSCECKRASGGAIYFSVPTKRTLTLDSLIFASCSSKEGGGALHLELADLTSSVTLTQCLFSGGANREGAYLYIKCADGAALAATDAWKNYASDYTSFKAEEKKYFVEETGSLKRKASLLHFLFPPTVDGSSQAFMSVGENGDDDNENCGWIDVPCASLSYAFDHREEYTLIKISEGTSSQNNPSGKTQCLCAVADTTGMTVEAETPNAIDAHVVELIALNSNVDVFHVSSGDLTLSSFSYKLSASFTGTSSFFTIAADGKVTLNKMKIFTNTASPAVTFASSLFNPLLGNLECKDSELEGISLESTPLVHIESESDSSVSASSYSSRLLFNQQSTITFTGCSFTDITRKSGSGAIIEIAGSAAPSVEISSCIITACQSTADDAKAGAMAISLETNAWPANLILKDLTFTAPSEEQTLKPTQGTYIAVSAPSIAVFSATLTWVKNLFPKAYSNYHTIDDGYLGMTTMHVSEDAYPFTFDLLHVRYRPSETGETTAHVSSVIGFSPTTASFGQDSDFCGWPEFPCITLSPLFTASSPPSSVLLLGSDHIAETSSCVFDKEDLSISVAPKETGGVLTKLVEKITGTLSPAAVFDISASSASFERLVFSLNRASSKALDCSLFKVHSGSFTLTSVSVTCLSSLEIPTPLISLSTGVHSTLVHVSIEKVTLSTGNGAAVNAALDSQSSFTISPQDDGTHRNLQSSSFSQCKADRGGAIYLRITDEPQQISLSSLSFDGCVARNSDGKGSGIFIVSSITSFFTTPDRFDELLQNSDDQSALVYWGRTVEDDDEEETILLDFTLLHLVNPSPEKLSQTRVYVDGVKGSDDFETCGWVDIPCSTIRNAIGDHTNFKEIDFTTHNQLTDTSYLRSTNADGFTIGGTSDTKDCLTFVSTITTEDDYLLTHATQLTVSNIKLVFPTSLTSGTITSAITSPSISLSNVRIEGSEVTKGETFSYSLIVIGENKLEASSLYINGITFSSDKQVLTFTPESSPEVTFIDSEFSSISSSSSSQSSLISATSASYTKLSLSFDNCLFLSCTSSTATEGGAIRVYIGDGLSLSFINCCEANKCECSQSTTPGQEGRGGFLYIDCVGTQTGTSLSHANAISLALTAMRFSENKATIGCDVFVLYNPDELTDPRSIFSEIAYPSDPSGNSIMGEESTTHILNNLLGEVTRQPDIYVSSDPALDPSDSLACGTSIKPCLTPFNAISHIELGEAAKLVVMDKTTASVGFTLSGVTLTCSEGKTSGTIQISTDVRLNEEDAVIRVCSYTSQSASNAIIQPKIEKINFVFEDGFTTDAQSIIVVDDQTTFTLQACSFATEALSLSLACPLLSVASGASLEATAVKVNTIQVEGEDTTLIRATKDQSSIRLTSCVFTDLLHSSQSSPSLISTHSSLSFTMDSCSFLYSASVEVYKLLEIARTTTLTNCEVKPTENGECIDLKGILIHLKDTSNAATTVTLDSWKFLKLTHDSISSLLHCESSSSTLILLHPIITLFTPAQAPLIYSKGVVEISSLELMNATNGDAVLHTQSSLLTVDVGGNHKLSQTTLSGISLTSESQPLFAGTLSLEDSYTEVFTLDGCTFSNILQEEGERSPVLIETAGLTQCVIVGCTFTGLNRQGIYPSLLSASPSLSLSVSNSFFYFSSSSPSLGVLMEIGCKTTINGCFFSSTPALNINAEKIILSSSLITLLATADLVLENSQFADFEVTSPLISTPTEDDQFSEKELKITNCKFANIEGASQTESVLLSTQSPVTLKQIIVNSCVWKKEKGGIMALGGGGSIIDCVFDVNATSSSSSSSSTKQRKINNDESDSLCMWTGSLLQLGGGEFLISATQFANASAGALGISGSSVVTIEEWDFVHNNAGNKDYPQLERNVLCTATQSETPSLDVKSMKEGSATTDDTTLWIQSDGCVLKGMALRHEECFYLPLVSDLDVIPNGDNSEATLHFTGALFIPCNLRYSLNLSDANVITKPIPSQVSIPSSHLLSSSSSSLFFITNNVASNSQETITALLDGDELESAKGKTVVGVAVLAGASTHPRYITPSTTVRFPTDREVQTSLEDSKSFFEKNLLYIAAGGGGLLLLLLILIIICCCCCCRKNKEPEETKEQGGAEMINTDAFDRSMSVSSLTPLIAATDNVQTTQQTVGTFACVQGVLMEQPFDTVAVSVERPLFSLVHFLPTRTNRNPFMWAATVGISAVDAVQHILNSLQASSQKGDQEYYFYISILHTLSPHSILYDSSDHLVAASLPSFLSVPTSKSNSDECVEDFGVVSLRYRSPELLEALLHNTGHDRKPLILSADAVYAIGLILYEVVTGEVVFDGYLSSRIHELVLHGAQPSLDSLSSMNKDFSSIVADCLQPLKDRLTLDQLKERLTKFLPEQQQPDFDKAPSQAADEGTEGPTA